TVFGGSITGPTGSLVKRGAGTLTLNGNNPYQGLTTILGGTLLVNGAQPASPVGIAPQATLGGTGVVGQISASGAISPGNSPAALTCAGIGFAALPVSLA